MSMDASAALDREAMPGAIEAQAMPGPWAEAALTVLFAGAAVLFVSFVVVITGTV